MCFPLSRNLACRTQDSTSIVHSSPPVHQFTHDLPPGVSQGTQTLYIRPQSDLGPSSMRRLIACFEIDHPRAVISGLRGRGTEMTRRQQLRRPLQSTELPTQRSTSRTSRPTCTSLPSILTVAALLACSRQSCRQLCCQSAVCCLQRVFCRGRSRPRRRFCVEPCFQSFAPCIWRRHGTGSP